MEDAAVYRHWTDAELELLADRSLAAALTAISVRPVAQADRGRDRPLAFSRVREAFRDGPAFPGGYTHGSPRGGRGDGRAGGIGPNRPASLTPPRKPVNA